VAEFCRENFISTLKENTSFKNRNYTKALEETFLAMDTKMKKLE
jgi:hypothetical protein